MPVKRTSFALKSRTLLALRLLSEALNMPLSQVVVRAVDDLSNRTLGRVITETVDEKEVVEKMAALRRRRLPWTWWWKTPKP